MALIPGNVGFGSKTEVAALRRDVCFTPLSGHRQAVSAGRSRPSAIGRPGPSEGTTLCGDRATAHYQDICPR